MTVSGTGRGLEAQDVATAGINLRTLTESKAFGKIVLMVVGAAIVVFGAMALSGVKWPLP